MSDVELVNLYWSTAGINPVEAEISPYDFRDRVESAAKAGFTGVALWHTDLEHILISRTLRDMKAILDDNGIGVFEVEFLADWFVSGGGRRREADARKKRLFEASAALNAHHVKVGDFYNTPVLMPQVVESFAALCKEAEDFGATIGFEFMASAMLPKLPEALAMVEEADAKNGGLIVDILHVVSQGSSNEDVAQIPGRFVISAELNDGALPDSPLYDPKRARRFCGEGDFDVQGFIAAIRQTGYDGPWAVEVMSPELTHLPPDELNRRAYETTMALFR